MSSDTRLATLTAELARVGAAAKVCQIEDAPNYVVDGVEPVAVCHPRDIDELAQCMAVFHRLGMAAIPTGNARQLSFGRPPQRYDVAISMQQMAHVLVHEAADLTVSVEAGVTLGVLNAHLAQFDQHLPLDPPHPESATVGAIIAGDASGPMRHSQGRVRDLLIGVRVVLADGTIVKGGGQVVKNVAGYDLMKLFTGSHGSLGVIAAASFKLRPLPSKVVLAVTRTDTLTSAIGTCLHLRDAAIDAFFMEAVDATVGLRCGLDTSAAIIGLVGSRSELAAQIDEVHRLAPGSAVVEEAASRQVYETLRDFPCASRDAWVARVSGLPSRLTGIVDQIATLASRAAVIVDMVVRPGSGLVWLSFEDCKAAPEVARQIRSAATHHHGWAVFPAMPTRFKSTIDPWGEVPAAGLQARIKQTLDPSFCLCPGRLPWLKDS